MSLLDNIEKEYGFSFAEHTTYCCGGRARVAYFPKNTLQTATVYDYLISSGEKFFILGNGSDVLASDNGFQGCVISTLKLKGIRRVNKNLLYCKAGTTVSELLKWCINNGVGGLEFLYGIPATVGGLAFMNGGVPARHMSDVVNFVTVYDGKRRVLTNDECAFTNKSSTMRGINCVITGVGINIEDKLQNSILESINKFKSVRSIQPKGKSCGCTFKNPQGLSAGKLIEECGLKGVKCGNATVSVEHANFIINNGKNSADVYRLIKTVKEKVFEFSGIMLEEEVVYIGEFNDTYF